MTSFLITWSVRPSTGWPYANVIRLLSEFTSQSYVDEHWRVISHKKARKGDEAWLLKQGDGDCCIFGFGHLLDGSKQRRDDKGKLRWMAPVHFTKLVDPLHRSLIAASSVASILRETQINSQSSGILIDPGQARALFAELKSS